LNPRVSDTVHGIAGTNREGGSPGCVSVRRPRLAGPRIAWLLHTRHGNTSVPFGRQHREVRLLARIHAGFMPMHADNAVIPIDLFGLVIGCAFIALNALGAGFHEKVYDNAPAIDMRASVRRASLFIRAKRFPYSAAPVARFPGRA